MDSSHDDEAPKDPGAQKAAQSHYDEKDFEGHRAHTVFIGVHVPLERRHSHRRHKHHHRNSESSTQEEDRPSTPPAQRVQFILGEDVVDETHESHPLFSEMEELVGDGDEMEWRETARWIKFEEVVEEGGNRWSKPHVATLSLHSLFELRSLLLNGTVILDMQAQSLEQVADLVIDNMINSNAINYTKKDKLREALLKRHRHQHQCKNHVMMPIIRSFAEIGRNHSTSKNGGISLLSCTRRRPSKHETELNIRTMEKKSTTQKRKGDYISVPAEYTTHVMGFTTWFTIRHSHPDKVEESSFGGLGKSPDFGRFLSIPGQGADRPEGLTKSSSNTFMPRNYSMGDLSNINGEIPQHNLNFMRKIPTGAEASNILVGEVDFLEKPLSAFIRLNTAVVMGDLTEVPVPTRFVFLLLGPTGANSNFHEVGRAMATLMSDEVFHEVAYKARNRNHLLAGVDEFLDAVTVLPPGEWDPTIRIEPPAAIPSQEVRKKPPEKPTQEVDEEEVEQKLRQETGLARTGRLFGGLVNDIKRKKPWYLSDFKDALAMQCIASWIFLYFACLSPIITFGGLLSEATGKNMAAMESLVSGFVCGMGYGFFSGQPLTILGSTGPVLVFETIVYDFCLTIGWDYLSFRFCIGTWITIILMILVAIDASALVCYITRFTEENFATLIAFIFIYKSVENVLSIGKRYPINTSGEIPSIYDCSCYLNGTNQLARTEIIDTKNFSIANCSLKSTKEEKPWIYNYNFIENFLQSLNGTLIGDSCSTYINYIPDVFLMSIVLYIGTFTMSVYLKDFKNALFFPSKIRQFISDFAVIIAIISMTMLDCKVGLPTPKLEVPHEFKPTLVDRGWLIPPFNDNPTYSALLALPPALLGTILIFMDQQITSVIINRKENKLKKSCGYHLDLFVLAILIQVCSIMGLPWFVAATVLSINHVNSLKLESECAAPGEKPQFLGVREQRVTHILIFLTIGLSVFLTPMLSHIPMPVLFGVFLYMGIASLKGLQFFDRILIMFMPSKYQPDYMFLRQVPLKKIHLFTIIQMACLICLWVIKSFSTTSILFPLMLVVMIGIRKALDLIFTRRELKILDDIMPEMSKRNGDGVKETEDKLDKETLEYVESGGDLKIPLVNGNIMKIPLTSINISEEVNKTGIWRQLNNISSSEKSKRTPNPVGRFKKKKHSKKEEKREEKPKLEKRLSTMAEEEDEDDGIIIKNQDSGHRSYWNISKKERSDKHEETNV